MVAETILAQLGGKRFTVMTGAKSFASGNNCLTFFIPLTNRVNHVTITLNASDLYDVKFSRYTSTTLSFKTISEFKDVGVESLRDLFTHETGLATSL